MIRNACSFQVVEFSTAGLPRPKETEQLLSESIKRCD
jgi:hypothetical protein